jgi:hypothetical protein
MMGKLGQSVHHVGLHGNRILFAVAEVLVGWRLLAGARVATRALAGKLPDEERAFYQGKLAAARFYCAEILPGLATSRTIIENSELGLMELAEEAF